MGTIDGRLDALEQRTGTGGPGLRFLMERPDGSIEDGHTGETWPDWEAAGEADGLTIAISQLDEGEATDG